MSIPTSQQNLDTELKHSLLDTDLLWAYFEEQWIEKFREKQITQALYKESIMNVEDITTLSKNLREQLSQKFVANTLTCVDTVEWPETTKFLFDLGDGKQIETVLMYHWHVKPEYEQELKQRKILRSWTKHDVGFETHTLNRITICISSQVWCAVGCIFCVTWKLWFKKNLHWTQIIEQITYANRYVYEKFGDKDDWTPWKVRNVVFMGMGEPMLNYPNIIRSIEAMLDQKRLGLSKRHITISTSWVASAMKKLVDDKVDVRLALSLHAPNQELRKELIPMIGTKRPLDQLMDTVDYYVEQTGQKIFYEYIMIRDKTDSQEIAHQLWNLLKYRDAHVNLIPYNENPMMPELETSDFNVIIAFQKTVKSYWVSVTVRDTLWRDVKGACGQLGYEAIMKKKVIEMDAYLKD